MNRTLKTWLHILTHPSETTFKTELEKNSASWGKALTWLVAAVVVLALLNTTSTFFVETIFSKFVGARQSFAVQILDRLGLAFNVEQVLFFAGSPFGGSVIAFFSTLILAPFILVIGLGICFGLAKLMGGSGSLEKHVYLFASFISPIMIVGGLSKFIPCAGLLLLLALWFYSLALSYFAVKSLHEFSRAKAIAAILVPYMILTVVLVVTNPPSM